MMESFSPACEAFLLELEGSVSLSPEHFQHMIRDFHVDMERGLHGRDSSLKMLPSFVDRPKGDERGRFLALDLGGTHLRVLEAALDGKGKAEALALKTFAVPKREMQGTGHRLFDFIAACIDRFLTDCSLDRAKTHDLAFVFSFPVQQTGIASGKLVRWTKGFTATGVEGRDVVFLLNQALRRQQISCLRVAALTNDTVGALMAGSYADPSCDMAVILGTGTNACYREKHIHIRKLRGLSPEGHMIVNMEWGNFDKARRTPYDLRVDELSVNPGAMYFEKMVSGMYLGEITRLVMLDAFRQGLVFQGAAPNWLHEKDALKTEDMSLIEKDDAPGLDEAEAFLNYRGISSTLSDRHFLRRVCRLVSERSMKLSAAAVSAVISWMDPDLAHRHAVAVDGGLFEKYPGYEMKMTKAIKERCRAQADRIRLVHPRDGSGVGAAITAAVAAAAKTAKPPSPST